MLAGEKKHGPTRVSVHKRCTRRRHAGLTLQCLFPAFLKYLGVDRRVRDSGGDLRPVFRLQVRAPRSHRLGNLGWRVRARKRRGLGCPVRLDEQVDAWLRVPELEQSGEREVVLALGLCESVTSVGPLHNDCHVYVPAWAASLVNPSRSPVARSSNISALRSPAFSKLSRAKSNRHTASARSPIAFHFVSASSSGTVLAISTAASRSSSWSDKSNFWSGSVVTSSASSFRPVLISEGST